MKLSRQRKISVVILALAVSALVADRAFLGGGSTGPGRASGASPGPVKPRLPAAPPAAAAPPAVMNALAPAGGQSLADRLRDYSRQRGIDASGVRDAFVAAESWRPKPQVAEAATRPVGRVPGFSEKHELMAVITGPKGSAIVDGKCLQVGQELDGYRLVSVGHREAVFECDGERVELRLKE